MAVVTVRMSVSMMVMGVFIMAVAFMVMIVFIGVRVGPIVPMVVVHGTMLGRDPVFVPVIMGVVRCARSIMFHSRGLPSIDRMFAGA
jgi:hypothetical protein